MKLPIQPARPKLKFECTRCGACCRRPGVVWLGEGEPERLAAYLGLGLREFRKRYLRKLMGRWIIEVPEDSGGCPLLDGDLCSVDEVKPGQCRAYPFWPELVDDPAAWRAEKKACEGIGRGPVVPDEVVARMLEIDPGPYTE